MRRSSRAWLWIVAGLGFVALALGGTRQGRALIAEGVQAVTERKTGPRWTGLTQAMRDAVLRVEAEAARRGVQVMFWDGWRSPAEEQQYIDKGTSKLKDPLNTLHAWGVAADFAIVNEFGAPSWPDASDHRWQVLADAIEAAGLKSGGRMWGWDWPHAQLPDVSVRELRAAYGDNYAAYIASNGGTGVTV